MTKLHFVTLIFLLFAISAKAQIVESGGEYENQKSALHHPYILGKIDGEFIAIRLSGYRMNVMRQMYKGDQDAVMSAVLLGGARFKNDNAINDELTYFTKNTYYYLEKYDDDLKQTFQAELDVEINTKGDIYMFKKFAILNNEIRGFSTFIDKKTDKITFYVHRVSTKGKMEKNPIELTSYIAKDKYNSSYDDAYNVSISPDHSKVLVYYHSFPYGKKGTGVPKIFAQLYNDKIEKIWEREITFPEMNNLEIEKLQVTNKGDVLVSISQPLSKEERKTLDIDERLYLFHHSNKENKTKEYRVDEDQLFANDVHYEFTGNNTLLIAGFYSTKSAKRSEGYFYREIDLASGDIIIDKKIPFTKEFIKLVMGSKKGEKAEDVKNMHVRRLLALKDGRKLIIAEEYSISMSSGNNLSIAYSANSDYIYNYEDIYVLVLDNKGNWTNTVKVIKYQKTINDNAQFNSFTPIVNDKELILIYNANRNDPNERMTNTSKATVYYTSINLNTLEQNTQQLFNAKDFKMVATPKFVFAENNSNIILHGKDGRYFRFFKISL
ncbi:MAG: hypothetical protein ACK4GL_12760 [Flavobacteriales bacterium]